MSEQCTWLPELILLETFGGAWGDYVEALYAAFSKDFLVPLPKFDGRRLGLKRMPEHEGKCCTFWHFISEGAREAERTPDLRRCERIRWPRRMLDEAAAGGDRVHVWSNARGTERRWVIAVTDFSYVLILTDRGEFLLPWTAYAVEYKNRRQQLKDECEAWVAQKG